jgi:hypothetical protein
MSSESIVPFTEPHFRGGSKILYEHRLEMSHVCHPFPDFTRRGFPSGTSIVGLQILRNLQNLSNTRPPIQTVSHTLFKNSPDHQVESATIQQPYAQHLPIHRSSDDQQAHPSPPKSCHESQSKETIAWPGRSATISYF